MSTLKPKKQTDPRVRYCESLGCGITILPPDGGSQAYSGDWFCRAHYPEVRRLEVERLEKGQQRKRRAR